MPHSLEIYKGAVINKIVFHVYNLLFLRAELFLIYIAKIVVQ